MENIPTATNPPQPVQTQPPAAPSPVPPAPMATPVPVPTPVVTPVTTPAPTVGAAPLPTTPAPVQTPMPAPVVTPPPVSKTKSNTLPMIIIVLIFLLIAAGVGAYYFMTMKPQEKTSDTVSPTPIVSVEPTGEMVACTLEAKICPDGSSVGRTGPNCEFAECPTEATGEAKNVSISLSTLKREKPASDPNFVLRSDNIKIGNDEQYIYLGFDPAVEGNESLENFKKYTDAQRTVVNIPHQDGRITESDQAIRDNMQINFTDYTNGLLKGSLTTKASRTIKTVMSNEPGCITDDMMGVCTKETPVNINLTIDFEVQVK